MQAQLNAAAARKELDKLRVDLLDTEPSREMATFIKRRQSSENYRSRLGVVAKARDDFEELTKLLAEAIRGLAQVGGRGKQGWDRGRALHPDRPDRPVHRRPGPVQGGGCRQRAPSGPSATRVPAVRRGRRGRSALAPPLAENLCRGRWPQPTSTRRSPRTSSAGGHAPEPSREDLPDSGRAPAHGQDRIRGARRQPCAKRRLVHERLDRGGRFERRDRRGR